jgi:chemotaxis protein MotA
MDIGILLGVILAAASIMIGAPDVREDIGVYLELNSFILVFGGTIASTLISIRLVDFKNLFTLFKKVMFNKSALKPAEAVEILVKVSEASQTSSRQALTKLGENKGDGFLTRALNLVGTGLDQEFINRTLVTDITEIRRRHISMNSMVKMMGTYAPMFGMAGTVIGVVQVLKNVTDIDNIVSGMAMALLTTLYGLFLNSVIFTPLSSKLKIQSDKEMLVKEIIREGIWMIMDKEIPLKVEKYLMAYLDRKEQNGKNKS